MRRTPSPANQIGRRERHPTEQELKLGIKTVLAVIQQRFEEARAKGATSEVQRPKIDPRVLSEDDQTVDPSLYTAESSEVFETQTTALVQRAMRNPAVRKSARRSTL